MANRNRMGTQSSNGYGSTNAANRRNSDYEFATELGANTPASTTAGANQAGRAGQVGRVGANRTQTAANRPGRYGR